MATTNARVKWVVILGVLAALSGCGRSACDDLNTCHVANDGADDKCDDQKISIAFGCAFGFGANDVCNCVGHHL
jgi:hypothetical protein